MESELASRGAEVGELKIAVATAEAKLTQQSTEFTRVKAELVQAKASIKALRTQNQATEAREASAVK